MDGFCHSPPPPPPPPLSTGPRKCEICKESGLVRSIYIHTHIHHVDSLSLRRHWAESLSFFFLIDLHVHFSPIHVDFLIHHLYVTVVCYRMNVGLSEGADFSFPLEDGTKSGPSFCFAYSIWSGLDKAAGLVWLGLVWVG